MLVLNPRMAKGKRASVVAIAAIIAAMTIGAPDAPATVAEQRARLPPAAECGSPVEGKWKAMAYWHDHWYEFRLEIHEDPSDHAQLSGMIYVDFWTGPKTSPEPPTPCGRRIKGQMTATGTFRNGHVAIHGSDFVTTEAVCGDAGRYNNDNFTGVLEPDRQEFQSVNDDGGDAVNEPVVFRRIGCFDNGRKDPGSAVTPPPFFPKRRDGGC
jgi:hypothetical protein